MQGWSLAKINNIPSLWGSFTYSYLCGSLKDICDFCSLESARRLDHKVDSFQSSTIQENKYTLYNLKTCIISGINLLPSTISFFQYLKKNSCNLIKSLQILGRYRKEVICKVVLNNSNYKIQENRHLKASFQHTNKAKGFWKAQKHFKSWNSYNILNQNNFKKLHVGYPTACPITLRFLSLYTVSSLVKKYC